MRAMMKVAGAIACMGFSAPAFACGGCFCTAVQAPVDQSAERIVFGVDDVNHKVDMHVQVFYEGPAASFAWVVPVPGVPDVALSTDQMFTALDSVTQPKFLTNYRTDGTCSDGGGGSSDTGFQGGGGGPGGGGGGGGGGAGGSGGSPGITILASGETGAFDWTVVSAVDTDALLGWLADPDHDPSTNDPYLVPPGIGAHLTPYVAGGSNFIAFKLQKDANAGDLTPVRLRFDGTTATIPLVLTAIAAKPDLRLEVYVLGKHRAVPDNYLHVAINEARIPWLSTNVYSWDTGGGGPGYGTQAEDAYKDLVTEAANEAGGQAFATDYFGYIPTMAPLLNVSAGTLAYLQTLTDPADYIPYLFAIGVPFDAVTLNLLREFAPEPQSAIDAFIVPDTNFYSFIAQNRVYTADMDFDPVATTAALLERVVTPSREAQALLDKYPLVTRLTSSMSAEEMTVDPIFVLNADMATTQSRTHEATLVTDCTGGPTYRNAPRYLELSDGRHVAVPPTSWFEHEGVDPADYVPIEAMPAAGSISDLGATGTGVMLVDNSAAIEGALADHAAAVAGITPEPDATDTDGGGGGGGGGGGDTDSTTTDDTKGPLCGCASTGGASGAGAATFLLLVAARRRRASTRA